MTARTDLALESRDSLGAGALPGVQSQKQTVRGLEVHDIRVLDARGAEALGKPVGRYLTLLLPPGRGEGREGLFSCVQALGELVRPMLPAGGPVLVWGLGNRAVTPDALGPQALDHLIVTRHLTALFPEEFAEMRPVSPPMASSASERLTYRQFLSTPPRFSRRRPDWFVADAACQSGRY